MADNLRGETRTSRQVLSALACALDPKLRRLLLSTNDVKRLQADAARSFIAVQAKTEPANAAASPLETTRSARPAEYHKRVLVRVSNGRLPEQVSDLAAKKITNDVFSINVPLSRIEELAQLKEVDYIDAGYEMAPLLDTSVAETKCNVVHDPPVGSGTPFTGKGVVVGIIDFGFDFTLDDFRNEDGTTRVAFFWDQLLRPGADESAPSGFTHGVEYTAKKINAALETDDPFKVVRHRVGQKAHGTHVAGTAAGNGRSGDDEFPAGKFVGTAPEATIIFVQPAPNDQKTSFTDSAHVAEAFRYIFDKAEELGMPCVVNMSLGQNGGSHDGESLVERAIDNLLEVPGRAFISAGGNDHKWRTHAGGNLAENNRTLKWRVGETAISMPDDAPEGTGDKTPNEMEVWYSSRDRFRVRVRDPHGNETDSVEPGESTGSTLASGDSVFITSERFAVLNGDSRIYIEISPDDSDVISAGNWEVDLEAIDVRDGSFDAWIERDLRKRSNRFRDQSFFVGADFAPSRTLGTPATSRRCITVANYNHETQTPSDSSGRGRTRDGRTKPEVAAPGTEIVASNSLGGRPTKSDPTKKYPMRVTKSGTSMAAPHVAGIVALILQRDPHLTTEQIRKIIIASAQPQNTNMAFDEAWGYGKIDAKAAIDLLD